MLNVNIKFVYKVKNHTPMRIYENLGSNEITVF